VSTADLLAFLRRELVPTPGRSGATLRITIASVLAVALVLMFRMPNNLLAFVMIYLIAQEDTAATIIGSILGWVTLTVGFTTVLLALELCLDIPWLRICFFAGYFFVGLFMKRALTVGAIGSAFGLPAGLAMILPDLAPPSAEVVVEFVLWLWWCGTLGVAINLGVQLLLSPGNPLTLLRRELDVRLQAVELALRRRSGQPSADPPRPSLSTLSIAGMTRPAAFLKTASLVNSWARARHESLAALITLADRLVTTAHALEALPSGAVAADEGARLRRAADGCRHLRQVLQTWRRPPPAQWVGLSPEPASAQGSLLADVERTLDKIVLAAPGTGALPAHRPGFFVPDAFENRDYVRFAIKGTLAALVCYIAFVGFDYPEIYTCVITVFVVALSTVGASNQKGLLRFGGAAVGGLIGLVALMYILPNVDGIGGFLVVFGAGCAVAAWANVGSPRISYGGYQVGLAFWKATLQGFGTAVSAQVIRDRLIGIAFGLIVFGLVEHYLWPERAMDALRARLSETLRLLADLARSGRSDRSLTSVEVDSWRQRISLKVAEAQGLIESSKFESHELDLDVVQRRTADAQVVFVLLLALARLRRDPGLPEPAQAAALGVDDAVAKTLEAMAARVSHGRELPTPDLQDALDALERSSVALPARAGAAIADEASGPLGLYRSLVATLIPLTPAPSRSSAAR
jgi:multidrug resistance protein MdtO